MSSAVAAAATRDVRGALSVRVFETRWAALAVAAFAFVLYLPVASLINRHRPDFFYLADAFLHGRTWLEPAPWLGPQDIVLLDGHVYLPFGPLPALVFMPLVAVLGVDLLSRLEFVVNAALAATCVGLAWPLLARFDRGDVRDRLWLVAFFGFSTNLWSITVAGGVWHTGQLTAMVALLLALLEATGRRRPLVMGILIGAALLGRTSLVLAIPFFGFVAWLEHAPAGPGERTMPSLTGEWRRGLAGAALVALAAAPALAFLAWYNSTRFGSPFEQGYGLATLIEPVLTAARAQGLFALTHLPTNLRYLLSEGPIPAPDPFILRPSGYGFPIWLQSPALFLAVKARWRDPLIIAAGLTALAVLIPSLLYYGGGFHQFGFRYLLDAMPFLLLLLGSAARMPVTRPWKVLILAGILVNLWGAIWS